MICILPPQVFLHAVSGLSESDPCFATLAAPVGYRVKGVSAAVYGLVLLLTVLIEWPVFTRILRTTAGSYGHLRWLGLLVTLNLATNPLVNFGFPAFARHAGFDYGTMLAQAELFAIAGEALILMAVANVEWRRASLASLAANLFSWSLGALITSWLPPELFS